MWTSVNIWDRMRVVTAAYHHGNLRAALVETGLAMARESGPDGVALREVARRVGVSHNAAYRHFADREELLAEIARPGHGPAHRGDAAPAGRDARGSRDR